jgi:hypothetical protein
MSDIAKDHSPRYKYEKYRVIAGGTAWAFHNLNLFFEKP